MSGAAILATASILSLTTGHANASPAVHYLFSPAHHPLGSAKHLNATAPVTQSFFGSEWAVDQVGSDQQGVAKYRLSSASAAGVKCLDVEGGILTAGTALTTAACDSSSATQNWALVPAQAGGKRTVKLVSTSSGLIAGVRGASTANGAPIELQVDVDQTSQKFYQTVVWPAG
ncbi:RICIN domain-containing protein [Kribbella sp. NPDC051770]|uniref:RICIN domain-containing protein n=1 Tax=Kribbella sp. NPDC051770 TaxID=3155413 RepID=UPI003441BCF1